MKKKFKSKWPPVTNPVLVAIENAAVTTPMRNAEHSAVEARAIDAFAQGRGSIQAWAHIVQMVNVAEVMCKSGIGIEVVERVAEAQVFMADCYRRRRETQVWSLTPVQVYLLRELREYHELQRLSVPYGQYRGFMKRVEDSVRTGNGPLLPDQILEKARENHAI